MKQDEKLKILKLIDLLLLENQKDIVSSQNTKDLIDKNITSLKEGFELNEMETPSERGSRFGLGLTRGIAEYEVSDEVCDAAHQIEAYFRTL
jgi:hypothetical protein